MKNKKLKIYSMLLAGCLALALTAGELSAITRVRDITRHIGERSNKLMGMGLIVGLKGTGDGGDVLITARPLLTWLQKMGNQAQLPELKDAKNVAVVSISANLSRNGVQNGDEIDVTVSSIGKAASLAGGILMPTPLRSLNHKDDTVYAWAEGMVSIPDENVPTVGTIPGGADIETGFQHNYVYIEESTKRSYFDLVLDQNHDSFQIANAIAVSIESMTSIPGSELKPELYYNAEKVAVVRDPKTIRIYIPESNLQNYTNYIARIMNLTVNIIESEAVVVINEKAGTIAFAGNVEISPCVITVDGLTIRIIKPKPQPAPGNPTITDTEFATFDTKGDNSAQIDSLLTALDQLNVPIKQKINAVYSLRDGGFLNARVIAK